MATKNPSEPAAPPAPTTTIKIKGSTSAKNQKLIAALTAVGLNPQLGASLKKLTFWQIGGSADYLIEPQTAEQTAETLKILRAFDVPHMVIGHGSNLLFDDAGYRGAIVKLGSSFSKYKIEGTTVRAEAGIWMPLLARACATEGLSGLEHTVGIPGNFGGLLYMNGGSMRQNIGDVVKSLDFLDEDCNTRTLLAKDCEFSYRHSIFQGTRKTILGATLKLTQSTREEVRARMIEVLAERKEKFPMDLPNCGSVFSNDEKIYQLYGPPGMVVDQTGLKGTRIGQAEVSPKHANFIVNHGGASSADVLALIKYIRQKVFERTGFYLRCEVIYVAPNGERGPAHLFV